MSNSDVEVIHAPKKSKIEPEKPSTDGKLDIRVYIIGINSTNTAFSRTRRSVKFTIENAACYLTNLNLEDYSKNTRPASIHAAMLQSFVVGHFGGIAKSVITQVQEGNAPKLLKSKQNTTNPDYDVSRKL